MIKIGTLSDFLNFYESFEKYRFDFKQIGLLAVIN